MSDPAPYVQNSVDMLDILPQLANGARCAVFVCIGLMELDPLGASKRDILDYTGLSRQTVESALRFLEVGGLITCDPASKRYRASTYYRCNPSHQQDVRELVPILQGERAEHVVKNFSTSLHDDDVHILPSSEGFKHHSLHAKTRELFDAIGVQGVNLDILARSVELECAEHWQAWVESKPQGYKLPVGYLVKQLKANPRAEPPAIHKPTERKREFHAQGVLWERLQAERAKNEKE